MQPITDQDLNEALRKVKISPGSMIFVHSDLRSFGFPEGVKDRGQLLNFYYRGLMRALTPEGTLAVPAYFYEYARFKKPFDVERSPVSKSLGVFSEFVNSIPGRVRSYNPLQSFAAVGAKAQELCGNSFAGYGISSPWERLYKEGGSLVFIGTTIQPMTFIHHVEQIFGVPHLYTKIYPYPVFKEGKALEGHPVSAVRYLEYGILYDLLPFQKILEENGVLNRSSLGQGEILSVAAKDVVEFGISCLNKNPYFFLKNPPHFINGKIPCDY